MKIKIKVTSIILLMLLLVVYIPTAVLALSNNDISENQKDIIVEGDKEVSQQQDEAFIETFNPSISDIIRKTPIIVTTPSGIDVGGVAPMASVIEEPGVGTSGYPVYFPASSSRNVSKTVPISGLKTVTRVVTDNGSVSYSVSGSSVTLNMSNGTPSYVKETISKSIIKTQTTSDFPNPLTYDDGEYNGTLYKVGSVSSKVIVGQSRFATDSRSNTVTNETNTKTNVKKTTYSASVPVSVEYNVDGYKGTLERKYTTQSTTIYWSKGDYSYNQTVYTAHYEGYPKKPDITEYSLKYEGNISRTITQYQYSATIYCTINPTVSLTSPTSNTSIRAGQSFTIRGSGTGNHHINLFYDGVAILSTQLGNEYSASHSDINYGSHSIQLKGRNTEKETDVGTALTSSSTATITIIPNIPTVSLSTSRNGNTITLSGSGKVWSKAEVYIDGNLQSGMTQQYICNETNNNSFTSSYNITATNKSYDTVTLKVYNANGESQMASQTVYPMTKPASPEVTLSDISNVQEGSTTLISAVGKNVSSMKLKINGALVGSYSDSVSYNYMPQTPGTYQVVIEAIGLSNEAFPTPEVKSVSKSFTVAPKPKANVSINNPTNGAVYDLGNSVPLEVSGSDCTTARIVLDGVEIYATNQSSFTWSKDLSGLTSGSHKIEAYYGNSYNNSNKSIQFEVKAPLIVVEDDFGNTASSAHWFEESSNGRTDISGKIERGNDTDCFRFIANKTGHYYFVTNDNIDITIQLVDQTTVLHGIDPNVVKKPTVELPKNGVIVPDSVNESNDSLSNKEPLDNIDLAPTRPIQRELILPQVVATDPGEGGSGIKQFYMTALNEYIVIVKRKVSTTTLVNESYTIAMMTPSSAPVSQETSVQKALKTRMVNLLTTNPVDDIDYSYLKNTEFAYEEVMNYFFLWFEEKSDNMLFLDNVYHACMDGYKNDAVAYWLSILEGGSSVTEIALHPMPSSYIANIPAPPVEDPVYGLITEDNRLIAKSPRDFYEKYYLVFEVITVPQYRWEGVSYEGVNYGAWSVFFYGEPATLKDMIEKGVEYSVAAGKTYLNQTKDQIAFDAGMKFGFTFGILKDIIDIGTLGYELGVYCQENPGEAANLIVNLHNPAYQIVLRDQAMKMILEPDTYKALYVAAKNHATEYYAQYQEDTPFVKGTKIGYLFYNVATFVMGPEIGFTSKLDDAAKVAAVASKAKILTSNYIGFLNKLKLSPETIFTAIKVIRFENEVVAIKYLDDSVQFIKKTDFVDDAIKAGLKVDDVARLETVAEAIANDKYTRTLLQSTRGFMDDMASILDNVGMSKSRFNQLRAVSADTLSATDRTAMKAIRESIPIPTNETIMQKVIPKADIDNYLNNGWGTVRGYTTRAQDTKQLTNYTDVFNSLRLDYDGTNFIPSTDNSLGVIRFKTQDVENIKVPYSESMGGTTSKAWPFTGNGFTAATNGQAIPEYCMITDSTVVEIMEGAEMYEVFKDGTEVFKAVFKNGKFVAIGGF